MIKYDKKQLTDNVTLYWLFVLRFLDLSLYVDIKKRRVCWLFAVFPFFSVNYGLRFGWWVNRRGNNERN